VCISLCFELQRLAVNPCAARRLIVWAILGVFGMNRLAGLVMIARRRGWNTRFKLFLSVWHELFGRKLSGESYEWIWCGSVLVSSEIDMEN